jgi:hypothetical protein
MRKPRTLAIALATALLLVTVARGGEDETPDQRARKLVEGQQSTIALCMHPTATLQSISCDRTTTKDDGDFALDYTFRFESWYGTKFSSKMRFHFYANGGLDSLAANGTNAVIKPFTASNLVYRWFKNRLTKNAGSDDSDQLRRLMKKGDTRQLLEWYLKAAQ